jgi:FixJ family two-component response regulator
MQLRAAMHPNTLVIALIESDLPTNLVISNQLRAQGFGVQSFESASELINSGNLGDFDCLLLDIELKGMTGTGLQQYLQDMGYGLPIIFMTGSDALEARMRAFNLGCSDFLCKPVRARDLVGAIELAMAGPHSHC